MKNNLGDIDRLIRFVSGIIMLLIAFASHLTSGWLLYSVVGTGIAFLVTSVMGICPFYKLIGFNTN